MTVPPPTTVLSNPAATNLLVFGSDHVGAVMKKELIAFLKTSTFTDWDIVDAGAPEGGWVDYPDYGAAVANAVLEPSTDKYSEAPPPIILHLTYQRHYLCRKTQNKSSA
ncbi:hypothetical protein HDV00_008179 [Rhizophlyctis rosea]|nr:hypothetical protein HDV00_008179 [Rhizophlyctis rosea]